MAKKSLLKNGKTEYTWIDLDEVDHQGIPYIYRVDELRVPENYKKEVDGFIITNTFEASGDPKQETSSDKSDEKLPVTGVSDSMLYPVSLMLVGSGLYLLLKSYRKKEEMN